VTPWTLPGVRQATLGPAVVARLAEPDDPQLSPDGTRLTYTLRTSAGSSYRRDVWLSTVDGAGRRRLSRGAGSASGCRWSPDGDRVAWCRQRPRGTRIEVLAVDAGIAEAVDAGIAEAVTATLPEIGELAWSPDARQIAFVGRIEAVKAPAEVGHRVGGLAFKRDGEGVVRDRPSLHVLDLDTGRIRTVWRTTGDLESPRWSPDGGLIAVRARDPGGYRSQVHVVAVTDEPRDEPVFVAGSATSRFRQFAWSPDGTALLLVGGPRFLFHPGLWLAELATAALRPIDEDPRCEVVDDPVWTGLDRALVHGRERGRSGIYELTIPDGRLEPLAIVDHRLWSMTTDRAGVRLTLVSESVNTPPSLVGLKPASGVWRQILPPDHRAARAELGSAERQTVRADGFDVDYWLLRPASLVAGQRAPAVVVVHGGPHLDVGDEWDGGLRQTLAAAGFVVAWANPRGSTSYGRVFGDAVIGDVGGGEFRDLMAVVDEVVRRDDVDPDRLGICGHSHGGYMTAWAVGQTDRFRAAVCMSPIVDLVSEWGMSDEGVNWAEYVLGRSPSEDPDWYRERSPSTHAWRARTPTLILHGERDERCPIGQSELLHAILRSTGCEVEFVRYPGAAHDLFGSPALVDDVLSRTVAWFRRSLGDAAGA
jgi:dipeptidyl aminopeptidase/acylaminoacyl peptidase